MNHIYGYEAALRDCSDALREMSEASTVDEMIGAQERVAHVAAQAQFSGKGIDKPLQYSDVRDALLFVRDASMRNYEGCLAEMDAALDDHQWVDAVNKLDAAHKAARAASKALAAAFESEDEMSASVMLTIKGQDRDAMEAASRAAQGMRNSAGALAGCADALTTAGFHESVKNSYAKAGVDVGVIVEGSRALSGRMKAMAEVLSVFPSKVLERAKTWGMPVARSASKAFFVFAGDVRGGVVDVAQAVSNAPDRAFDAIDAAGDRFKGKLNETGEAVSQKVLGIFSRGKAVLEKAIEQKKAAELAISRKLSAASLNAQAAANVASGFGRSVVNSFREERNKLLETPHQAIEPVLAPSPAAPRP